VSGLGGLLRLDQIVSAFVGAGIALGVQWIVARARRAATARSLAIAFWEELSAAQFASNGVDNKGRPQFFTIGGFSSQTFDSLFREMAQSLPDSLARDLMRYHWRVKFLLEAHKGDDYLDGHAKFYHVAEGLRTGLLDRLKFYSGRSVVRLMLLGGE
jgi:hypothetical protein